MGYRLVQKSMTLNDLERRNGPCSLRYFAEFTGNLILETCRLDN